MSKWVCKCLILSKVAPESDLVHARDRLTLWTTCDLNTWLLSLISDIYWAVVGASCAAATHSIADSHHLHHLIHTVRPVEIISTKMILFSHVIVATRSLSVHSFLFCSSIIFFSQKREETGHFRAETSGQREESPGGYLVGVCRDSGEKIDGGK